MAVDEAGSLFVTGAFQGNLDFSPDSGVDDYTTAGSMDGFYNNFLAQTVILTSTVFLPLATAPVISSQTACR